MTWLLLLLLTSITIASRVLPMTLLPTPSGRVAEILEALPAPLFAALAGLALVDGGRAPAPEVLVATAAALVGATRRSLGLTLLLGVTGFLLARSLLT